MAVQHTLADEPVQLLPSGALYLQAHHALLVADAHIGKASSFRQLGVPVPRGTTGETLQTISADLHHTQAQRLIFLGDFLHSRHAHRSVSTQAELARWRRAHELLPISLVRGNHDDRAGDPAASLRIDVVDEPLMLGAFALCHHPQAVAGRYTLAGHWHPCIMLQGRARERLRLPCFWLGDAQQRPIGILPAYGSFTGMHPIERQALDMVFAIAGEQVRQV
jgi:uncharacterized protein